MSLGYKLNCSIEKVGLKNIYIFAGNSRFEVTLNWKQWFSEDPCDVGDWLLRLKVKGNMNVEYSKCVFLQIQFRRFMHEIPTYYNKLFSHFEGYVTSTLRVLNVVFFKHAQTCWKPSVDIRSSIGHFWKSYARCYSPYFETTHETLTLTCY